MVATGTNLKQRVKKYRNVACSKCAWWLPPGEAAFNRILEQYKRNADKSGRLWLISDALAKRLFESPCHYCGTLRGRFKSSGSSNDGYWYNGIDRIDNSLGYTEDNSVSCCWFCNRAKGDRSYGEFINWLNAVASHRRG